MSERAPMRHLLLFLPGIMGSVLQKDGRDLWALSGQALVQYLRSWVPLPNYMDNLRLVDDDWLREDLGDGITAPRIIEDLHSVPGLIESAGYGVILNRLEEVFDVVRGDPLHPNDHANFYPFPYDWRRDNRANAHRLKTFIDYQLPRWQQASGAYDAEVIIVAHSMGGLVSRYYLEVLEGWKVCRNLFTIGTPHRGALNAVDTLGNGFKNFLGDLSQLVRSFTSIYQLLPTYPMVEVDGRTLRVSETSLPNIDQQRAEEAREHFHEIIRKSAITNREVKGYEQRTIPWVGTRQDTYQSAQMSEGTLLLSYFPPAGLDQSFADGDGTVPRISAIPADLDGKGYGRYAIERHGWLTNNQMTLEPLIDTIKQLAVTGTQNFFGDVGGTTRPAFNLRLDSLVAINEPLVVRIGLRDAEQKQGFILRLDAVGHQAEGVHEALELDPEATVELDIEGLVAGLYQVTVQPTTDSEQAPSAVHGCIEVVEPL